MSFRNRAQFLRIGAHFVIFLAVFLSNAFKESSYGRRDCEEFHLDKPYIFREIGL